MSKFKEGDVVQLKSGGPEMTVFRVPEDDDDHYFCKWFTGDKLKKGGFPEGALRSASEAKDA